MGLFSFIGGIIGGNKQAKATKQAAQLQYDAQMKGIEESKRQFDVTRGDFQPYQELGKSAAPRLQALSGAGGVDAQMAEILALKNGPEYQALYENGRDAILANASATGGLRGGNTENGLARFGRDTLSDMIGTQLSRYGGLVDIGRGAAGNVGAFGADAVARQADYRNAGAAAMAQSALVRGGIAAQNWQNAGSFLDNGITNAAGGGGFNWKSLFF